MENEEHEDVLESWELADGNKNLEKQIEAQLQKQQMKILSGENDTYGESRSTGTAKFTTGGTQSTTATASNSAGPPGGQIKILKRPNNPALHPSASAGNLKSGSGVSKKTLEEREAAYAEARLRIFGGNNNGTSAGGSEEMTLTPPVGTPTSQLPNSTTPKIMTRNQSFELNKLSK